jgi:type I restriction enzyme S subunit
MMQLPRYESYKDSGVEWLGEIPEHWGCDTLRSATLLKSDKNRPDLQVLSVYREYGVIIKDSRDDNHNATSLDTSTYKVVQPGDLVVNKMKAWQGSMGVSEYEGVVSPAYITCKTNQDDFHPKYLHYLLRSKGYVGVYNSISYGVRIGQWDLRYEDFKKVVIPIPLIGEQKRIAAFLDQKTAEIDEAIAKKQKLIELLQEQKSILINQAVTKGLNPDVPMKDSGIEWIGEIPAHWEVKRLKHISLSVQTGRTPPTANASLFENGTINWFTPGDFGDSCVVNSAQKKLHQTALKNKFINLYEKNSILFIGIGATLGRVALMKTEGSCNQQINIIRIDDLQNTMYYVYLLNCIRRSVFETTNFTTLPILNQSQTKQILIVRPPHKEQSEIVNICDDVNKEFYIAHKKVKEQITKLQEYKSSLISSVVTGKIKV